MTEWTVPVRNVLFLALPRRAFRLPASLCACFLGTRFLAGFILVVIEPSFSVPASRAAANTQYTIILARAFWPCPGAWPSLGFRFCRQSQCEACRSTDARSARRAIQCRAFCLVVVHRLATPPVRALEEYDGMLMT